MCVISWLLWFKLCCQNRVVRGLANLHPHIQESTLKHPHVNLINVRTFKSGNHKVILADCFSKYKVGNLDTKTLGSGEEYNVLKYLLWYCLIK